MESGSLDKKMMILSFSMEAYIIGSIIKEYRIRLEISQEDLAYGLCAVSTLSRVENGAQIPGRKLAEAFFSRMGINPPSNAIPMSRADFKRENLEYEIIDKTSNGDFQITALLEEYKKSKKELDKLETQFYSFFKSLSEDVLKHNCKKALKEFETALKLTMPNYELGKIPNTKMLTKIEIFILNNIARNLYFYENKEEGLSLMEFLHSYFEDGIISEEEKAKNYPVILLNLENWYGQNEEYEKALELSEKGIDICIRYGKLTQFPYQLFNKGCSLINLKKINEGKEYLNQAFTIMEAMKLYDDLEYGKKWVKDNLNI